MKRAFSVKALAADVLLATVRGSGPFVPSIFFILARRSFFKRGRVLDKMIIDPPHRRDFTIDLQQCWSINRKIGDRQCTYYLIVRALTVADCCFFCSCRCMGAIT